MADNSNGSRPKQLARMLAGKKPQEQNRVIIQSNLTANELREVYNLLLHPTLLGGLNGIVDQNEELNPTQPTPGFHKCDDIGNGERLAARHGWRLRYLKEWGWMVYNGKYWENDRGKVAQFAKETTRSILAEAAACDDDNISKAMTAWAATSASESKRTAMLATAESEPIIMAHPDNFNNNPWVINCENGVLDLKSSYLNKHDSDLMITKMAGAAYMPEMYCPLWLAFLDRIFNSDQSLIDFIQRAAGYTLTGITGEHCLFFLYGTGANGKSTFTETLQAVMGSYAQKTPTDTLMVKYQDNNVPNDIARLAGARMVSAAELGEDKRLNEPLVKDLTGGDKIAARFLHKEFFEFNPIFKLWIYGNHKPEIHGTDYAIWRRVRLIPFTVTIPEKEQDKELREKLRTELPGILAWCVNGCKNWILDGLNTPDAVKNATDEYRQSQDILGAFLAECCIVSDIATIQSREMYTAYKKWSEEAGAKPISEIAFNRRMADKGFHGIHNRMKQKFYHGIGLLVKNEQS